MTETKTDSGQQAATKVMGILDQKEVNYTPVSITPGKACSSCLWWRGYGCHIVVSGPEEIVPNGYCDEHRVATPLAPQPIAPIPVVIVGEVEEPGEAEMALPVTRRMLTEALRPIADFLQPIAKMLTPTEPVFSVFKANGRAYWISRHTGKFIDRQEEILSNKAHDEYVERVQAGKVPLPELWTWHKKGTKHGEALMVWKSGGFTLALGQFDDTPEGRKAFEFYQKNRGKIKLSHMFNYPKHAKQNGVYHAYNTIEITTLPDGAEAFPYTSFEEIDMTLTDAQREFIRGIGGDDMVKRAETADSKAQTDTKTLEGLGVQSKGLDNFEGATIPQDESAKALEGFEIRLKAVEGLPNLFEAMKAVVKQLTADVKAAQEGESAALKKANDLEQRLNEYMALKAPASQSADTVLGERETAQLKTAEEKSKLESQKSLVDRMVGS